MKGRKRWIHPITMTASGFGFCAGLLTWRGAIRREQTSYSTTKRSEQFRPAIAFALSDHGDRDEHFFSLFQVF